MSIRAVALLLCATAGCGPCLERCAGLWQLHLSGAGNPPPGVYTLVLDTDTETSFVGTCVVEADGAATCDAGLGLRTDDDGYVFEAHSGDIDATQVEVEFSLERSILLQATAPIDYADNNSCNPNCKSATVEFELP
ncbi:MAG: hypothetical protein AAGA54_12380 [Myxococcota bacterium]